MGLYRELFRLADDLAGIDVLHMCEAAGLVVSISDSRGRMLHLSDSMKTALGIEGDDPGWFTRLRWTAEDGSELTPREHPALLVRTTGIEQSNVRVRARAPGGGEAWLQLSLTPLSNDEHGWAVLAIGSDITSTKQAESELRRLATHDGLTGLANRAGVRDFVLHCLAGPAGAASEGTRLGALMIDIDHFKTINDRFGHQAGDEALEAIADALRDGLRPGDLAARWGGEEFIVVAPDADLPSAAEIGEQLRARIAGHPLSLPTLPEDSPPLHLTISVGVAVARCARPGEFERLVECADRALYDAKRAGRNRVSIDAPIEGVSPRSTLRAADPADARDRDTTSAEGSAGLATAV